MGGPPPNLHVESEEGEEDNLYQEIGESEIAGTLEVLLNDTIVSYLKIYSESERGNLEKIDAGIFKELVELVELEVKNHKVKNIDKKAFEQNVDLKKIDFSDNEITDLDPELFGNLFELREVNFQQNRLRSLPENLFEKNVDVLVINFARNRIQEISKKLIDKLENLQEIIFNDNRIKSISNRFFRKTNLKKFYFNNNEIEKIEESGVVRSIDFNNELEIHLSNNKLESLPANIFKGLENIQKLDFSNNSIKSLSFATLSNTSYEILDFSNNKIVEIPHEFSDNVIEIYLNNNRIKSISDQIWKTEKLRNVRLNNNAIAKIEVSGVFRSIDFENQLKINLSNNKLESLPGNIFSGLENIQKLDFSNNSIKSLNSDTFLKTSIETLDFSNNKIVQIPREFSDNLKEIYLNNNRIKTISDQIFKKLSLEEVQLNNNDIEKIEVSGVFRSIDFKNQLKINLSNNKLESLPGNIFSGLEAIRAIDFSNNAIKSLNSDTFSKTSIQTIDFSNNKIVEISRDFPDNFQEIILNGNKIRKIHDSLYKNKKNLSYLFLRGNQIDKICVCERRTEIVDIDEDEDNSLRIYLSANNLKELKPHTFGSIKQILNLDLSENSLTFLPENLFYGSNVGDLNFANNLIEELDPNSFENAQLSVWWANFSSNKIELLDEGIFDNWKRLSYIDFSHNRIKVLPEKLFDNQIKYSLHGALFSNNQISKIGNHTFVNCRNLDRLDLSNNACFDIDFGDASRDQHEVCSDNCDDSCFIVNGYHMHPTYRTRGPRPGAFRGQNVCEKGQIFIRYKCRYARRNQG